MKEVKKCSISGIAFTMEADAFQVLSRYLESLNDTYRNTDGGKEIVEDIEARIAELILSHQDNSKVVELSLVEEIIAQMGSAEAIREQEGREAPRGEGRIPRRLYRDMDQARLGGVCSGVAKYFGTSPTWIRLLMFLPLILLLLLGWIPFFWWLVPLMSNLLGVFFICYLIMWFAVPAARTARQKLEQNGQRITVQSIEEASAANHDVDADAKPVVAKAVYALGQVVLIVLKLLAGLLVFGLILGACALIIGLFAVGMAGPEVVSIDAGIWTGLDWTVCNCNGIIACMAYLHLAFQTQIGTYHRFERRLNYEQESIKNRRRNHVGSRCCLCCRSTWTSRNEFPME